MTFDADRELSFEKNWLIDICLNTAKVFDRAKRLLEKAGVTDEMDDRIPRLGFM